MKGQAQLQGRLMSNRLSLKSTVEKCNGMHFQCSVEKVHLSYLQKEVYYSDKLSDNIRKSLSRLYICINNKPQLKKASLVSNMLLSFVVMHYQKR